MRTVSHRASVFAIVLIASLIGVGTMQPLEAATFRPSKIQEARNARLQRHLKKAAGSSSSSSSGRSVRPRAKRHGSGGSGANRTEAGPNSHVAIPTISFSNISKNYGDSSFYLVPTSDSDGGFTFSSNNDTVATISGNTVTIHNAGTVTITATLGATSRFAGSSATATLTVNTIAPTIIPLISISKVTTDPPFVLSDPTSNSAGAFTFTSTNPGVALISGRTVTIAGPGTTTIISTQAASGNYKSGSGTTSLTVSVGLEEA